MTRLDELLLRLVPSAWRDDVRRDLAEQCPERGAGLWMAIRVLEIGTRLRAARLADALHTPPRRQWRSPMNSFARDLAFAVRSLLRQPAFAVTVIATLAIGIGANSAIYSMFNWILFRPIPGVQRPEQLVTIRFQTPKSSGRFFVQYLDYAELRDRITSLSGLAASLPLTLYAASDPRDDGRRLEGELVTTNYFRVLGISPALGREFAQADERPIDDVPPAIISHAFWKRTFNADPAVLGKSLSLDGHSFTVVGVAPQGFQGRSLVTATDVWVPVGAQVILMPHYGRTALTARGPSLFGDAIGRLNPGVDLAAAQAEATSVADASTEFSSRGPGKPKSSIRPVLYAGLGHDTFARDRMTTMFKLLMGAVGLVLLLACANAGNLLLARTSSRRREIAVRQAIGASRFRVVRQQFAEGLVLALAGGAAGLALAQLLTTFFDGMRILDYLPAVSGVTVDLRVALFTLGASLVTAVLFATAPAIAGTRVDLLPALKDGLTVTRVGRPVLRTGLVLLQITLSLVLLVGAGLFIRTLHNLRTVDLGMRIDGLSSFQLDPSRLGHSPERSQQILRDVLDRMVATPGIDSAALAWSTPLGNMRAEMSFTRPEAPKTAFDAAATGVSPGYFSTMGIPLVAGRDFTSTEFGRLNTASGVIILNQALARQIFPDGGAVGSRLKLDYPEKMEVEVVGVVGDVRGRRIAADPEPFAYEPIGQRWPMSWGSVIVRSSLPAADTAASARAIARQVDPRFTPPLVESFALMLDRALAEQRLFARLSAAFGGIALFLAGMGIYAMMAGSVAERRREFGIRLALGATAASMQRQVLRRSIILGVIGITAGLIASVAIRRFIEARLFGVTAIDPVTLASASAVIVALCMIASVVPALRAARVDPVRSLRVD